jgi:hypothetical protein
LSADATKKPQPLPATSYHLARKALNNQLRVLVDLKVIDRLVVLLRLDNVVAHTTCGADRISIILSHTRSKPAHLPSTAASTCRQYPGNHHAAYHMQVGKQPQPKAAQQTLETAWWWSHKANAQVTSIGLPLPLDSRYRTTAGKKKPEAQLREACKGNAKSVNEATACAVH